MQLFKRSSNGNYSKLLEITIQGYLESKDRLHTVRGLMKSVAITTQLSAFYSIEVPTAKKKEVEPSWISTLRDAKPKSMIKRDKETFTELELVVYSSGAIDYMLELPQVAEQLCEKYIQIVNRQLAEFLVELWIVGYTRQSELHQR